MLGGNSVALCSARQAEKDFSLDFLSFFPTSRDRVERALNQKAADNTYAEAVDYSQFFSQPVILFHLTRIELESEHNDDDDEGETYFFDNNNEARDE